MIVPMKKVAVIVQSKDSPSTIQRLRLLGALHVEHQQTPKGKDVTLLKDDIALIKEAIGILSRAEFLDKNRRQEDEEVSDWKFLSKHVIDCWKRLNQLQEYSRRLASTISQWEQWGDFDPEMIGALAEKNIYLKLYQVPAKEIKNFPPTVIVKKISSAAGIVRCVAIAQEKIDVPFKEVNLPKTGLGKMRTRLAEDNKVMASIRDEIRNYRIYLYRLESIKQSLEKDLEFQEALNGMGKSEDIMYLKGYIPYDVVNSLLETAKSERWGIIISKPSGEDMVPTLIRNPRWVSIISPIFKALEVIPGYREFDISLWFLVFLSIFFGMLIGDAGYGIIFFMLTVFVQKKFGRKLADKSVFILFYLFSFCAIVWGGLSGTFFGQAWLPQWVKPVLPALRDNRNVQIICFLLGALHLSIGHFWRSIVKLPSLMALADIGWITILWGAFFLARTLILGDIFPLWGKWFFVVGPILVVFFTSLKRNILKGIGAGFGNLLLNLVNSFTDVVSYIRLFAVGLATVAVADSFNKMAIDVGYSSIVATALTVFILLLGHTLNIILGPMSVLVHGVRLNVLEFCNHIDVKWSGIAYRPLK